VPFWVSPPPAPPFPGRAVSPYVAEIAMRPDVEAMKADIEQSVALLRRRL